MLKKVLTYFFTLVFLLSVTGVSLQLHTCLSAGKTKVSFYPEYFGAQQSCCCSTLKSEAVAENHNIPSVQEVPCCSDNHILYKIPTFQNQRAAFSFVKTFIATPVFVYIEMPRSSDSESPVASEYRPPPLALAGITFIHFSHQSKIPVPLS